MEDTLEKALARYLKREGIPFVEGKRLSLEFNHHKGGEYHPCDYYFEISNGKKVIRRIEDYDFSEFIAELLNQSEEREDV